MLRSIDGLLLVMTEKSFSLMYDAEKIIEDCIANQREVNKALEVRPVTKVRQAPTLLFSTYAHLDILGLGACPWTYIRAVSDCMVEVRDMASEELLGNGQVTWTDGGDQIAPDFLMFHPDDSSRVIHVRTQEIRILGIHMRDGKRVLEEEFTYPEKKKSSDNEEETRYSRSGRRFKPIFKLDNSLNRALSFNVETDIRVLVILEAWKDVEKYNCITLEKVVFYDSFTYELLHQMDVGVRVEGDIWTNRLSVSIDRDVLNIVSHKGSQHTVLAFRLKENFSREDQDSEDNEEVEGTSRRSSNRNFKRKRTLPTYDSDYDGRGSGSRRRQGANKRARREPNRVNRRKRNRRSLRESSESGTEDSDEWRP
ncbi:DDB1- and CUL4-associated factor 17 [Chionoecetes opilio]|uniref:DDB1- and CUL4-associated factor 17 n=1 Tax=Chionoecetes opilio TaxID=41210 RepID=A0A8J4XN31_CHIOP|nr:DDB1- and CUL4-associated factor 17 [Chionoecetes opilio]